jgi:hypothetical protein
MKSGLKINSNRKKINIGGACDSAAESGFVTGTQPGTDGGDEEALVTAVPLAA